MILKLQGPGNARLIKELGYIVQGEWRRFFVNFLINRRAIYHGLLLVKLDLQLEGYQREDPDTNQYFV